MRANMTEVEKLAYARKLGVSTRKVYDSDGHLLEEELNSRILEHEQARRGQWLWLFALLACIGSVLSALAAWTAIARTIANWSDQRSTSIMPVADSTALTRDSSLATGSETARIFAASSGTDSSIVSTSDPLTA